ncbi:MAG: DUF805 domain-containing protein [Chitinophagaceae bacterium]|nr:DUF805 domain-containing protein [Chitinophagaceae bacterium]
MKWYLKVLKDFGNFRGRARRSEYWYFALFNFIFAIVAMLLDNLIGTTFDIEGVPIPYGYIYLLYVLAVFIPGLAVAVRRLHDVGKSGWFLLIVLIPLIGAIWLLVLYFTEGQPGENKWGPNPKSIPLVDADQLTI